MSDTAAIMMQETIMFLGLFALVGWVLFLVYKRYQTRTQMNAQKMETFGKLVDKFSDSKEFVDFVRSSEGRNLLRDSGVNGINAKQVALRMFIVAALLFAVGYGFMSGAPLYDNSLDPNFISKHNELRYWGKMAFGLAVGFIAAGVMTRFFGDDSGKKDKPGNA